MSSAQETINKLSEALNTLITAYEELQNENNGLKNVNSDFKKENNDLKNVITQLKADKEKIVQENNNLHDNVSVLSNNTEEQNSSMYNMLDKIESLLGNEIQIENKVVEKKEEKKTMREPEIPSLIENEVESEAVPIVDEIDNDSASDSKIDLNRMASMLNGFNK